MDEVNNTNNTKPNSQQNLNQQKQTPSTPPQTPPSNYVVVSNSPGSTGNKLKLIMAIVPLFLIVITIFVVGFFVLFFYQHDMIVLKENALLAGAEVSLEEGQTVNVELGNEDLDFKLVSKTEDSSRIKANDGEEYNVNINEELIIDSDGDGVVDLGITLKKSEDGELKYLFKKIERERADSIGNQTLRGKKVKVVEKDFRGSIISNETEQNCASLGGQICSGLETECTGNFRTVLGEECCLGDCYNSFQSCNDLGGIEVRESNHCKGRIVDSTDDFICCLGEKYSESEYCEDVVCDENYKCSLGECILKNCSEIGGVICSSDKVCTNSSLITSFDSKRCCFSKTQIESCADYQATIPNSCTVDSDCTDHSDTTYDYCSNSKCYFLTDSMETFNIDTAQDTAITLSDLLNYCGSSQIIESDPDSTNANPYICEVDTYYTWCKTWIFECTTEDSRISQTITVSKKKEENSYLIKSKGEIETTSLGGTGGDSNGD